VLCARMLFLMGAQKIHPRDCLIVFGRYPVPGKTKTRLIPVLGPAGAAELQRHITEKTFKAAQAFASRSRVDLQFCYDGGSEKQMRRWLGPRVLFSKQRPGNLGERMETAFHDAFRNGYGRVVLVGTDVPDMTDRYIETAFDALGERDLVLGPSADGGYWLVGLKGPMPIFENISWGTEEVLAETLSASRGLGLSTYCLDRLRDIDTEEDLEQRFKGWARPYLSVIIPALNEAGTIEAAIHRAWSDDVEIHVVDGGSTDETAAQAARAGARILNSHRGRALQQNRGAAAAEGRVLLFLHADTHLPENYVFHVFETFMDPGVVLGAFRFRTDLDRPSMRLMEAATNLRSRLLRLPYGDQALFIRKEIFRASGGFPEVPIAEDFLFVRHVSKHGRIVVAPAEAVTSARRWKSRGMLRTFWINQIVLFGLALRIPPHVLATLYRRPTNTVNT
jgi:rSAM/selenodomain-associated transferase 2/rSAM/selenodomain-associated transferase 1